MVWHVLKKDENDWMKRKMNGLWSEMCKT